MFPLESNSCSRNESIKGVKSYFAFQLPASIPGVEGGVSAIQHSQTFQADLYTLYAKV
jgi:hypothetical protein